MERETRRRDIGVMGGLVLVVQALSSLHSSESINSILQQQLDHLKERQETQIATYSGKIDKLASEMSELKKQVKELKTLFENSEYSLNEETDDFEFRPKAVSYGTRLRKRP